MRKLMAMMLMLGLVIGPAVMIAKAADFDIHLGKDRSHGSSYDRGFGRWDARQRDRLGDAYRDGLITDNEYNRLTGELSNVEAFHNQAMSKGWMSDRERNRLDRMEARLSADIEREVSEHADY